MEELEIVRVAGRKRFHMRGTAKGEESQHIAMVEIGMIFANFDANSFTDHIYLIYVLNGYQNTFLMCNALNNASTTRISRTSATLPYHTISSNVSQSHISSSGLDCLRLQLV